MWGRYHSVLCPNLSTSSSSAEAITDWSPPPTSAKPAAESSFSKLANWSAAAPSPRKSGPAIASPPPPTYPSLMQEKVVRELELEKHGYIVDAKDPAFFSPFPDGRHLFMWQDRAKTLAEIAKFSQRDAEAYPKYEAHLERLAIVAESLLLTTPPHFPPRPRDLPDYLKLLGLSRGLSTEEIVGLVKIFTQSAADFLDHWFESEQLKVTLATDGVIGANGGPRSPGTAYILLHHCMGGVNGHRGLWGFVRGGMGADFERHRRFRARRRARRFAPTRPLQKILVKKGRAHGVVLDNGEEIQAKIIASNLDPRRTFLKLMDAADLPTDFLDSIRSFPIRRHVAQDEPRAQRTSRVHSAARRARPAASRDHAYLPFGRIHRARLG